MPYADRATALPLVPPLRYLAPNIGYVLINPPK